MSDPILKDDVLFYQRLLKSSGYDTLGLDGVWGKHTSEADKAFSDDALKLASKIGQFDARTERNILSLQIAAQEAARHFMKAMSALPFTCKIISGTRSYAEQDLLYSKGRSGNPGPIVTNAKGGQSNHNFGIAWDIGLFDKNGNYLAGSNKTETAAYAAAAALVDKKVLEWGGDWKTFVDIPHYQLRTGKSTSDVRKLFEAGKPLTT